MIRHTTINLDLDLLDEAKATFGTSGTSETIRRALREAVDREKRRKFLELDFSSLTEEVLAEMRKPRTFGSSAGEA